MPIDPIIQELMNLVLPPDGGDQARSTSDFGKDRTEGTTPHVGLDLNRGKNVQPHGRVTSPVHGRIKEIVPKLGRIVIEEWNPITKKPTGYDVEILHTQTQNVKPDDKVEPKQQIGTQGDVGAARGAFHAHVQVVRGNRTPLNPLRHLFEYHYPGATVPALPQFEPQQVPPRAQRGPAPPPGNQEPLAPGADGKATADPFQQGGKPIPYLAQRQPGAYDQPNPLDSAEWPFGPIGAPGASVNANDIARQDFSALQNFRWYRPSYLPSSDAASPAAPIPPDGSLPISPLMTPGMTRGVGRIGPVVAPAIPFIAAAPPSAPGGIPGLLMQAGIGDPLNPEAPPPGGLLGLLQEYMRNNAGGHD